MVCLQFLLLILFAFAANAASRPEDLPPHDDPDAYFDGTLGEVPATDAPRAIDREHLHTGYLTTSLGTNLAGRASLIQTDGRMLVGGRYDVDATSFSNWALVRYFNDGSVDTSFGSAGLATTSFGDRINQEDILHALALQTDGKIIAAGRATPGNSSEGRFGIVRFLTTGQLDTSFLTVGKLFSSLANRTVVVARGIAIDTDGRSVVSGYSWNSATYDGTIARYNTDGQIDTSFSTDGYEIVSMTAFDDGFLAVTIQTDGSPVAAGHSWNNTDWDYAVARFLTDGGLDTSFNTSGKLNQIGGASNDRIFSVVQDRATGNLYGGGSYYAVSDFDMGLIRLLPTGNLDTTFHTDGKYTLSPGTADPSDDVISAVALQTDGKIYGSGYAENASKDFYLLRLLTSGNLDTSFKFVGSLATSVTANDDYAMSFSMLGDGYLIQAGRSNVGGGKLGIALARYNTDGTLARSGYPDMSFGTGGQLQFTIGATNNYGSHLQELPDKKILVSGYANSGEWDVALMRLNSNATLDTSFHTDGTQTTDVRDTDLPFQTAVDTLGNYVSAGLSYNGGNYGPLVTRHLPDGNLDTTFETDGAFLNDIWNVDRATSVAIWTDGKLLVGGRGGAYGFILRLHSNGGFDTSFYTSGWTNHYWGTTDQATFRCLSVEPDGKTVIYGETAVNPGFLILRIHTSGRVDTSFHTDGIAMQTILDAPNTFAPPNGCAKDGDNYWTAGYSYNTTAANYRWSNIRFRSDGIVDTTFNTSGFNFTSHLLYTYGGMLSGNGRYLAVGDVAAGAGDNLIVERYKSDGVIDTVFGSNGISYTNFSGEDMGYAITRKQNGMICMTGSGTSLTKLAMACIWP